MTTDLVSLLGQVLQEAADEVSVANGDRTDLDEDNTKAQLAFQALGLCELRRKSYRTVQAQIVASMVRDSDGGPLWLAHPGTPDYPSGFGNLREFLLAAGVGRSTAYELCALADVIQGCDVQGIVVDPYLSEAKYPMLAETVYQLRDTLEGKSDEFTASEILGDVALATTRDSVREKYRRSRTSVVGNASVSYLNDGRAVLVAVVPSTEEMGVLVNKLAGVVTWDRLVAVAGQRRNSIQVVIDNAA